MRLTVQLHHGRTWHDAGELTLHDVDGGHRGASTFSYDPTYFYEHGASPLADNTPLVDARAVSVRAPVDLQDRTAATWPAFVLDLLPQGHARTKLSAALGLDANAPSTEVPLLLRGAGSPVGNLRVKEAHEDEEERIAGLPRIGVALEDILAKSERFLEVSDYHAMIASGSSGLQGEWPKIAMTLASDGLWYPDTLVADHEARAHVIVKLNRGNRRDELILEGEAAYPALAHRFGIRVHDPAGFRYRRDTGVLVVPRFDRVVEDGAVVRLGQESIISASGIAAFGHVDRHETYLEALRAVSSNPLADVTEYVLRDALNLATGNPDNHGRNTALTKRDDGTVRLSPLFDFAPMRLADSSQGRPTKWGCMAPSFKDAEPDWAGVCEVAAGDDLPATAIMAALAKREPLFRDLPRLARACGVPEEVIELAISGRHLAIADGLAQLAARLDRTGGP